EAQLSRRVPPFPLRRVGEDVLDRDRRALGDGSPGRPTADPDPELAQEPGRRLRPVLRTDELEEVRIRCITEEDGAETGSDERRDPGQGEAVDFQRPCGGQERVSDFADDLQLTLLQRLRRFLRRGSGEMGRSFGAHVSFDGRRAWSEWAAGFRVPARSNLLTRPRSRSTVPETFP